MKKTVLLISAILYMSCLTYSQNTQKQDFELLKKEYTLLKEQTKIQVENMQKEYDFLKNQTQSLRENIETERENHYDFVENTYLYITLIFSVVLGILTFFGFKTFSDAKKNADKIIIKKIEDYEKTVDKKIAKEIAKIIKEKPEIILNIIKKYTDDSYIRENKKILILSDKQKSDYQEILIKDEAYKNVNSDLFSNFFIFENNENFTIKPQKKFNEIQKYDAVILDHISTFETDKHSEKFINFIRKTNTTIKLMFFGIYVPKNKYFKNISATQMPPEIGNNLFNLLKK